MESHDDREHTNPVKERFIKELESRAEKMKKEGASKITGGHIGEAPISEWIHKAQTGFQITQIHCRKMPDDPQSILRISIGVGVTIANLDYLVFRGDRQRCVQLLRRALIALEGTEC